MDQDGTWHGVGLSPGDFMLDGNPALSTKRGRSPSPQFSAHVYCGQRAGWIKMAPVMEVGGRMGRKLGSGPQFSAHFYCGQTAGWITMALGMEVGLSPGDFVLDVVPASLPKKGRSPPIFGTCLLWSNGCTVQDATWYRGRPRPTRHCVKCGPSSIPSPKWAQPPIFRLMCVVAKRLDGL